MKEAPCMFCGSLLHVVLTLKKSAALTPLVLVVMFIGGALIWPYATSFTGVSLHEGFPTFSSRMQAKKTKFPLKCAPGNVTQTCPANYPIAYEIEDSSAEACPEYFRWIHEDLRLWKRGGISRDMVEMAKGIADIRLVIVNGTVYVEKYRNVFQTRDVFTIWGILQLRRLYPGKVPDLDLMFQCGDKPSMKKSFFSEVNIEKAPPLFHYCGDNSTLDIVFPDWSFWGWPEINVRPWKSLKRELEKGNHRTKWMDREPYAYWKGNAAVSEERYRLMLCNVTDEKDWNARIYTVAWSNESRQGFTNTNLANQCNHRYKIYAEGVAWSVSEKYILACDSVTLLITPHYHDFFTRSLLPMIHYWPVNGSDICRSIKYAVDWGNSHIQKAQEIGKAGSSFINEELKMQHVYDYMLHLLNEYAKLLKYKPTVPSGAIEVCSEKLACNVEGLEKMFELESLVEAPAVRSPCTMPSPFDPHTLQSFLGRKENLKKQVAMWEASGQI